MHTGDEVVQVDAEMDLAIATAKEVGDSDIEEERAEANPVSTGAAKIVQDARETARKAEGMSVTLGGFTDPLPTDVAPLPPPFLSHG